MNSARLKFWRWAHRNAESLCRWIYLNKLTDTKRLESAAFINSKGEPVIPHTNGRGCSYLTHAQVESLTEHQKEALRNMGWPN